VTLVPASHLACFDFTPASDSGWIARLKRVRPFVGAGAGADAELGICGAIWAVSALSDCCDNRFACGQRERPG